MVMKRLSTCLSISAYNELIKRAGSRDILKWALTGRVIDIVNKGVLPPINYENRGNVDEQLTFGIDDASYYGFLKLVESTPSNGSEVIRSIAYSMLSDNSEIVSNYNIVNTKRKRRTSVRLTEKPLREKTLYSINMRIPQNLYEKLEQYAILDRRNVNGMAMFILCDILQKGNANNVSSILAFFDNQLNSVSSSSE
jgi:hypothetical protein